MDFLEHVAALDRALFLALNGTHAPWADQLMLFASGMVNWFPLYVFFLWLIQRHYGWRGLAWSVPMIALLVLCSDKGSVLLFKETVQRLRPCHEPSLQGLVHLVPAGCGGRFGFISSHASNHFAIATFMAVLLRGRPFWGLVLLIAWAGLIAYSRIHLGVHYPGDVIAGAFYGSIIGCAFGALYRRLMLHLNTRLA